MVLDTWYFNDVVDGQMISSLVAARPALSSLMIDRFGLWHLIWLYHTPTATSLRKLEVIWEGELAYVFDTQVLGKFLGHLYSRVVNLKIDFSSATSSNTAQGKTFSNECSINISLNFRIIGGRGVIRNTIIQDLELRASDPFKASAILANFCLSGLTCLKLDFDLKDLRAFDGPVVHGPNNDDAFVDLFPILGQVDAIFRTWTPIETEDMKTTVRTSTRFLRTCEEQGILHWSFISKQ
jgi:hypothetical protein